MKRFNFEMKRYYSIIVLQETSQPKQLYLFSLALHCGLSGIFTPLSVYCITFHIYYWLKISNTKSLLNITNCMSQKVGRWVGINGCRVLAGCVGPLLPAGSRQLFTVHSTGRSVALNHFQLTSIFIQLLHHSPV